MAETPEASESEPSAAATETSPAAVALALGRTSKGAKALDEDARTFLREQTDLIRLQKEHLHEQRLLVLSRLGLGRWKDRFSLALQAMTAAVGLAVVVTVAVMAWQAHEDHGLVIGAFSVPPDLARDGLTGEVVAARFQDKLQAMQTATQSDRPANTYQNNWGDEIKLEIPETGLTFGEFDKLLRDRLGQASRVTGEVHKTPTGVALTARLGDDPAKVFEGTEANLEALEQQAAEAVYRNSQPYRYSAYLEQHGRLDEAFEVIADLATNGPLTERVWAYAQWAMFDLNDHGDLAAARIHANQAIASSGDGDPIVDAEIALVNVETWSGHDQAALVLSRPLQRNSQRRTPGMTKEFFEQNRLLSTGWLEVLVGDQRAAANNWMRVSKTPEYLGIVHLSPALAATSYLHDHDPQAARKAMASLGRPADASFLEPDVFWAFDVFPDYWADAEAGDWAGALAEARASDAWLETNKARRKVFGLMQRVWIQPLEALALAHTGDIAGADALIQTTPADCYLCLRVRGRIAAQARDWAGADRWFAEAVRQGPDMPYAYSEWSEALLAKGDLDGAIARSRQARATGPHFADPMELQGEALLRKGDFSGAAASFEQADRDAPHWGKNHLLWGEALARLGRADEARTQFRIAAGLDLLAADRAALQIHLKTSGQQG